MLRRPSGFVSSGWIDGRRKIRLCFRVSSRLVASSFDSSSTACADGTLRAGNAASKPFPGAELGVAPGSWEPVDAVRASAYLGDASEVGEPAGCAGAFDTPPPIAPLVARARQAPRAPPSVQSRCSGSEILGPGV